MKLQEDIDRFKVLGKEMWHEIPTNKMQYNADFKETDQKHHSFVYFRGKSHWKSRKYQISWHYYY